MSDFTTHFITAHKFLKEGEFSKQFSDAFYYGVQGPDLLINRTPLAPGEGMRFGSSIHDVVPIKLFELDSSEIFSMPEDYQGYYFGVMLHYFGDRMMHQYIGHLTKSDTRRFAHISFERDIDVLAYKDYFNEEIKNFKVKDFYRYSEKLNCTILSFWQKRQSHYLVSFKHIKRCMKNIVAFANFFKSPHKTFVAVMKVFEGKKYEGIFTGHIKYTNRPEIMNYERKTWTSPTGEVNLSVWDFLDEAILHLANERKLIKEKIENNENYLFTRKESFSYGCED